jgi:hypothetical protein
MIRMPSLWKTSSKPSVYLLSHFLKILTWRLVVVVRGGVRGEGLDTVWIVEIPQACPLAIHTRLRRGWARPVAGSGLALAVADRVSVS